MNNNNIVAAAEIEAARNLKIYNELAKIAREVFTHINAETGKIYTPADIARAIVGGPVVTCVNGLNYRCDRVEKYAIGNGLQFADDYSPETVYDVEIDGFSCRVNGWKIFNVLDRAARAWDIASAARVTFEKPYETAARVVSFTLSAAAARELAACCAKDLLRPVMNGVHLDTRRRCLVASNGHVLRVLQMGAALTVDETAAASSYIIPADVLKSGRVVTIDANGIVSTDKKSAPAIAGRYPNYMSVIPGASGRIDITADQWKQIKKAVADVAKVHDKKDSYHRVTIAHETASDKLIIHAFNYDFNRERETAVNIDTAAPAFSLSFNADYFAKIAGTPTALYIKDNSRALVAVDGSGLSLIMPLLQPSDDKYYINFNFAESYGDYLPGLNIAAAAAEIKEENEAAAAAEIVAKVREECKGKSTKSMLKYINDNFGWSSALQRARDILTAEIESEKNTAAPAADIETSETAAAPAADIESTTANDTTAPAIVANDDTAAPAADIESTTANDDSQTARPRWKSLNDFSAQLSRINAIADTYRPARRDKNGEIVIYCTCPYHYSLPIIRGDQKKYNEASDRAAAARRIVAAYRKNIETATGRDFWDVNEKFAPAIYRGLTTANDDTAAPAADIESEGTDTPAEVAAPAADSIESQTAEPTPAETIAAPAADSIETPAAPAADSIEAETIEADPLPLLSIDTAAGVIVWGLADELPTADGLTADTVTPADLLTIEAEHAESERADRADLLTVATADSIEADTDRAERRPLLLTIARHALRLAAAAALLLLLTIAPDRAADTLAAPADLTATPAPADVLTITPDTLTAAAPAADSIEAETITAADLLTADSEAESRAELAAPADSPRPAAERRHARENKRESHARALLTVATADSIAAPAADSIAAPLLTIEADTLTAAPLLLTADSIEADTLAAQVATLEQAREITAPADTLAAGSTLEAPREITDTPTADTDSEADTITTNEPTDDTDPAAADSESDTTPTDTAANGHPHAHGSTPATMATPCSPSAPLAPVAPILI